MKILGKALLILMISICMFSVMPNNVLAAAKKTTTTTTDTKDTKDSNPSASNVIGKITPTNPNNDVSTDFANVIGNVLGFLRIASALVAVIMLAVTGFNYIMSDAQDKAAYLKKFAPIIIGFILVFSATTIAKFLIGIAGNK